MCTIVSDHIIIVSVGHGEQFLLLFKIKNAINVVVHKMLSFFIK